MPCSSCPNSPIAPSVEPVPVPVPVLEPVVPVIPSFETKGSLELANTGNAFTDLASVIPFAISAINAYITSLAVQQKSTEPNFFNSPYLYSLSNSLVLGNYLESSFTEGIFVTTTYLVPYQSESRIETATIITIFNSETKILFFQIPNEFSYNSVELASVATVQIDTGYQAKIIIPYSFIVKQNLGGEIVIDLTILIPIVKPSITNTQPSQVLLSSSACNLNSRKRERSTCQGLTQTECNQFKRCTQSEQAAYFAACEWNGTTCYADSECTGYSLFHTCPK